jgi:hypothetical protein
MPVFFLQTRRDAKMDKRDRYVGRKASQAGRDARKPERVHPEDQFADVFAGPTN